MSQESLLYVLKKGELLAFVGPDVGNRLWIGELIRDANPNDQLLEVSWLKVIKIQRDSDAANVGVTVLPTLATHTFTATNASLVGLAAKDISLDDQRLIFCCHCTQIQPVVDQVNYVLYFPG